MRVSRPRKQSSGSEAVPEQLSLDAFEAPPLTEHAVFFAIYPDVMMADRLLMLAQQLRERCGLKGRPLRKELFHTTLFALPPSGKLTRERVAAAREAGDALAVRPFEVEFDSAMSFARALSKHPFVLSGDEGLGRWKEFQGLLGLASLKAGAVQSLPPYQPHLTLLYDEQVVPRQRVEPIRWTVREFFLVRSIHGENRHEVLGQWALRG
jgi:RNA 2',3'-cyclic 3'-phosphodiesterase